MNDFILAAAPMEDVTDTVFRQIIAQCAPPDVFYTEFTNIDGMLSKGAARVMHRLKYSPIEQPIMAQLWGTDPKKFSEATQMVVDMGFDGIDINMGCPDRSVMKKGACAGLIGNFKQVEVIVNAVKAAAKGLPISVKTHLGVKDMQTEEWIGFLLKQELDTIIIHGRTVRELSDHPAHWDEIGKAVTLRNSLGVTTRIIGNGDVLSKAEAYEKRAQFGVDGVMIGRGIFHNLYVFGGTIEFKTLSKEIKIAHLARHISLFDATWGSTKNFAIMKKFYKMYISDFDGASEMRVKLMELTNAKSTLQFLGV